MSPIIRTVPLGGQPSTSYRGEQALFSELKAAGDRDARMARRAALAQRLHGLASALCPAARRAARVT